MSINTDRKSKRLSLVELPAIPHKYILKPKQPPHHELVIKQKSPNEPNRTYPELVVKNNITNIRSSQNNQQGGTKTHSSWQFDSIPNLNGIASRRIRSLATMSRALWTREDTFDADYMMPGRVREILKSEGLENGVINRAIGKSEEKHKKLLQKMAADQRGERAVEIPREVIFPPVVSTQQRSPAVTNLGPSSWLDLARHESDQTLWHVPMRAENRGDNSLGSLGHLNWDFGKCFYTESNRSVRVEGLKRMGSTVFRVENPHQGKGVNHNMEDKQMEMDKKKWQSTQHAELLFFGNQFEPPRVVLVSSKIPNCHLLTAVYNNDVIPIIYDFDTWSFADILDEIDRKLDLYRRNCKAKSIMVLCQGGPGYIYLLRNFVITPQKLNKASYRVVVGFWRSLAEHTSKLRPDESAIHIVGFKLLENDQGRKLLPMLQSLMYPNMVKVVIVSDDGDEGKSILGKYFKYSRYIIWKLHQNSSAHDIDYSPGNDGTVSPKKVSKLTLSIR